jgi:hypothetical protein
MNPTPYKLSGRQTHVFGIVKWLLEESKRKEWHRFSGILFKIKVALFSFVLWICICSIYPVFIIYHFRGFYHHSFPARRLQIFLLYHFIVFSCPFFRPRPPCALCEFGESEGVQGVSFSSRQMSTEIMYQASGLNLWISLENMMFNHYKKLPWNLYISVLTHVSVFKTEQQDLTG